MRTCHKLSRDWPVGVGVGEVRQHVIPGSNVRVCDTGTWLGRRERSDEIGAAVPTREAFADDLAGEGEVGGAASTAKVRGVAGEIGGLGWRGTRRVRGSGGVVRGCSAGAIGAGLAPAEGQGGNQVGWEERWWRRGVVGEGWHGGCFLAVRTTIGRWCESESEDVPALAGEGLHSIPYI